MNMPHNSHFNFHLVGEYVRGLIPVFDCQTGLDFGLLASILELVHSRPCIKLLYIFLRVSVDCFVANNYFLVEC